MFLKKRTINIILLLLAIFGILFAFRFTKYFTSILNLQEGFTPYELCALNCTSQVCMENCQKIFNYTPTTPPAPPATQTQPTSTQTIADTTGSPTTQTTGSSTTGSPTTQTTGSSTTGSPTTQTTGSSTTGSAIQVQGSSITGSSLQGSSINYDIDFVKSGYANHEVTFTPK